MGFFGSKKASAAPVLEHEPPAVRPTASPAAGSPAKKRRLWAGLVALSALLSFAFGGLLAGMIYLKVSTPPLAEVAARPKPRKEAKAPEPEKPEAKPAEPAKSEPEAKPEPKAEAKAEPAKEPVKETAKADRPTGSPSVHAPALPKRSAEPIADKGAKPVVTPASAQSPGEKPKAKSVEFTHKAPEAKDVQLKGPFLVRTGGKKQMVKDSQGIWRVSISLLPGAYKFSYVVDGKRGSPQTLNVE